MKKVFSTLLLFLFAIVTSTLFAQSTDSTCTVNPSITSGMLNVDGDCFRNDVIYTYTDYQNLSVGHDSILGVPIDSMNNPDADQTSNDNMVDLLAGSFGNMSLADIYDCLEIGCSPHLDTLSGQVGAMGNALSNNTLSSGDINSIYDGEPQDSIDAFENEFGAPGDLGPILGAAMSNLNIDSIIAAAFGATSDCDTEDWLGALTDGLPPLTSGDSGGGDALKSEIKASVAQILSSVLSGNSDLGSDPNWFLGEIEGLGMAGSSTTMPSPNAMSAVAAAQGGVNLYNGTGSFGLPLDNISAKDVSVPISVSSNPGGLTVDAQEGTLGSNMNLSSGGKITRVVKGLPDDFEGTIHGHGYGYRRGLKLITELADVRVSVRINIKNRIIRRIICKILKILLEDLLNLPTGGGPDCGDSFNEILQEIKADDTLDAATRAALKKTADSLLTVGGKVKKFIDDPHFLFNEKLGPYVSISSSWQALNFNYLNLNVDVNIPLFGDKVILSVGLTIRTGLKVVDLPSKVDIKKECIGYSHLMTSNTMDDFDLSTVDVNDFANLSEKDKFEFLNKMHATKKRDDHEFFDPRSFSFLDMFHNIANFFNSSHTHPTPRYTSKQIDLEPDEYYYDFGGYSGKFYFQPNGKDIVLVPYQDFTIEVNEERKNILSFTFITPEGVAYTFDKVSTSQSNHYNLPTSFKYSESEANGNHFYFSAPSMGKVEYPSFKGVMGIPLGLEVKKDYLTNYYVEQGPSYTSAWHATKIESLISREKIDITYLDRNITYNASKNWTHTFPNFGKEGNQFKTKANPDLSILDFRKEWRNGFADLTYSMSEINITEPYINTIDNNRGKTAKFVYGQANPSMPGASLCTSIEVMKNENFFKGWNFHYTTPDYTQIAVSCNEATTSTEEGQGPAFAEGNEYHLDMEVSSKDENDRFAFYFPFVIEIVCVKFYIPVPIRWDIEDNDQSEYYFANAVTELGSLLHIKSFLGLTDNKEVDRYQSEFARNFLYSIEEINSSTNIVEFEYLGDKSLLPKRYSINQDIWGYYNGISSQQSPFIKQQYASITPGLKTYNTDHFAFSNPEASTFSQGRNWEADLALAKIGQLSTITTETGGVLSYTYDLHEYPEGNPLNISAGGLRISSFTKSSNAASKTTTYEYLHPTVINYPLFLDQHPLNTYYKNLEERVTASWQPLNEWQRNKGGYVGYGQVNEIFAGNGHVEHYFTNPQQEKYRPEMPATEKLFLRYHRILKFDNENFMTPEVSSLAYHPSFAPLISRDWRLGLETRSAVFDNDGNIQQDNYKEFTFMPMLDKKGTLKYPKTNMYQYLHYGTPNQLKSSALLYNLVDGLTECPRNIYHHIIRFLIKQVITEHPFRYVEKTFPISTVLVESVKVEAHSSSATSYFKNGSSSVTTSYSYHDNTERKIKQVTQSFSNNQSASTEYWYADNFPANYAGAHTFMTIPVLKEMDEANNYEIPVLEISRQNGIVVAGSATNFQQIDSSFLAHSVWSIREGQFVLTGKFEEYEDRMP
ncbi:MAG: hypothetical protein AB8G15_00005, partial [Saprospiraceae bacterium]